jgi:hypothetical protein
LNSHKIVAVLHQVFLVQNAQILSERKNLFHQPLIKKHYLFSAAMVKGPILPVCEMPLAF